MTTRLARMTDWHRPLMVFSVLMLATTAISAVGLIVDDRTLVGAPIWLKPFKFSVSLLAYSVTWAWLLSLHPTRPRWLHRTATVITWAGVIEMAVIIGQVVRGRRSHFNVETGLDMTLFIIMGVTIATLWVANIAAAVPITRHADVPKPTRVAIGLGLGTSIVGMLTGFMMSRQDTSDLKGTGGAHSIGVVDGGPGMPVTGWNLTGGDLRVGHFVGIHALQVLPLVAIALTALAARYAVLASERVRTRLVWTAGGVYFGLFLVVTWQALRGQSLADTDGLTLTGFAAVLAGGAIGAVWARSGERELVDA